MTTNLGPPGVPAHLRGGLVELSRREWTWADAFELDALTDFLRAAGLTVANSLIASGPVPSGGPVGAAIMLSGDIRPDPRRSEPAATPAPLVPKACAVVYAHSHAVTAPPPGGSATVGTWEDSWTEKEHAAAVDAVREAIAAGEVYQVNVVGHRSAPFSGDPAAVSRALARIEHTPYAGSLAGEGWSVHSASPECLVEVVDGVASTRPIKGTRASSPDRDEDERARQALAASTKDRAEHVMIVDLARNDLGRLSVTGGVAVRRLYDVRKLAGVWHAESRVTARLRPGTGVAELLAAAFPGGSVTGAPKIAALRIIDALEPVGRGPAMGALGWIGADGTVSLGLTIRTVAIADSRIHLWAGGGVTWSSEAAAEVSEAAAKAAPILTALEALS